MLRDPRQCVCAEKAENAEKVNKELFALSKPNRQLDDNDQVKNRPRIGRRPGNHVRKGEGHRSRRL